MLLELITSAFILVGGAFTLLGSVGLARLAVFFSRLHGPAKATTMGVGSIVIASVVHFSADDTGLGAQELAIAMFLFITAPVSAHLLAKAALRERQRAKEAAEREAAANEDAA